MHDLGLRWVLSKSTAYGNELLHWQDFQYARQSMSPGAFSKYFGKYFKHSDKNIFVTFHIYIYIIIEDTLNLWLVGGKFWQTLQDSKY